VGLSARARLAEGARDAVFGSSEKKERLGDIARAAGGCQDSRREEDRAGVSNLQLGPILGEQALTKLAALLDRQSCILSCVEKCEQCKCQTCTKHAGFAAKRSGPLHIPRQIARLLQP
jgi:hypothetical protein